jgi:hypothetical protein
VLSALSLRELGYRLETRVLRRAVGHASPEPGTLDKVSRLPLEVRPAWEKYEPACEIQILRYSGRGLSGA